MIYTIYICTYGKYNLAHGAAINLRKYVKDKNIHIVLMDASDTIKDGPYDSIDNTYFTRWMGIANLRHKHKYGPGICVDDDMRLVDYVTLGDRYNNGNYKVFNGNMIIAWNHMETLIKTPYNLLSNYRMHKNYVASKIKDPSLLYLCNQNQSEHIDDIWIHIDKGSEKLTDSRSQLIDYFEHYV